MTYNEEMYAKDLIKEVRELRKVYEKSEENKQKPVAMINIPLDDYDALRDEIEELKRNNEALKEREGAIELLLSKLDIPFEELEIITDDIFVAKDDSPVDFTTNYMIKFAARRR